MSLRALGFGIGWLACLVTSAPALGQVVETANFSITRIQPVRATALPRDGWVTASTREERLYATLTHGTANTSLDDKVRLLAPCSPTCVFAIPLSGDNPLFEDGGQITLALYDRNETRTQTYLLNGRVDTAPPEMLPLQVAFGSRSESVFGATAEGVAQLTFLAPQDDGDVVAMLIQTSTSGGAFRTVSASNDVKCRPCEIEVAVALNDETCIRALAVDAAGKESVPTAPVCGQPEASGCQAAGGLGAGSGSGLAAVLATAFLRRRRLRRDALAGGRIH